MTGLTTVLDRATDLIEQPHLAGRALVHARRRQTRHRVLAVAAAAVAVGAVVAVTQLPGNDGDQQPVEPSTPSVPTPSITDGAGIDPYDQPPWDPFTIGDERLRPSVLPKRLEPPAQVPSVVDNPMEAAVVAWPEEGRDLRLLGTDGAWRSVSGTADAVTGTLRDVVDPALSTDGRQVAMAANDGILVVDVTTGAQRLIPWPDPIAAPSDDAPSLLWLPGNDGFAVLHWTGTWLVSHAGDALEGPFGREYGLSLAIDPDGPIIEHRWRRDQLIEWEGGQVVRRVDFPYQGERFVTRHGLVAFTTGSVGEYPLGGPVVADIETGELLAHAPIRDPNAVYSEKHLTAQGFLDEDTVLLLVTPMDFRTMDLGDGTAHLVAWHFRTGEFERIASGGDGMHWIAVAADVLDGH